MLSLFFLISYFNLEANVSHKITLCTFMFAGHQFTYELNTLPSPLQVDCKGVYHTFVYFRIGSHIKQITGPYTETSYNENLNILDINETNFKKLKFKDFFYKHKTLMNIIDYNEFKNIF